jgi:hypothetical protein
MPLLQPVTSATLLSTLKFNMLNFILEMSDNYINFLMTAAT